MSENFDQVEIRKLFDIVKESICPFLFPDEEFAHHSLPAFDSTGGPTVEFGRQIESNKTLLAEPAVLLSKLNPRTSRVSLADPTNDTHRHCCSTEFIAYKAKKGVSNVFYKYFFQTDKFRIRLQNVAIGTTNSHVRVTPSEILDWKVPYPSMAEQTKISEILLTVDQAIKQTENLITKQQRIKTGLMQDLLTRGIDEHGNLRSEETHEFKDSPLGRIPMEWDDFKLGDCSEICNHLRKPISAQVRENMKGDYPYYGPTGILDYINEYRVDGKFVLIGEDGDHFLKFKTQEMTLLIEGKYNVNNHAHVLRGRNNILTEWLHLFFLHRDITLHLTRQGAGRFKLNKAALLGLPLIAPKDPEEQYRILKVMDILRKKQSSNIENLNKLKSIKNGLMQDLLTGKKRVIALLSDKEM